MAIGMKGHNITMAAVVVVVVAMVPLPDQTIMDGLVQRCCQYRRRNAYGNGNSARGFSGAPLARRTIWVSRVHNGDTQCLRDYMESSNVQVFDIVKVSHVEARFSSYRITISVADRDSVFSESFWSAGVKCR